ncbi:hypothetical protein [Amycolatopsis sp. FDAARGOS 1241]|uniref:hypothetical protein n=1 Tax=Amycolatopsis sp. FDAARGOS 1241 TaxID=2778070 RepID=UPI00194FF55C|nr:hypothetical protein [Amycolatopsis sp. FDAARGOS 1241]QRP48980.1 hypothetical protein I6J71_14945 [Amycolatopsis sp. FDAARGOS 1241]
MSNNNITNQVERFGIYSGEAVAKAEEREAWFRQAQGTPPALAPALKAISEAKDETAMIKAVDKYRELQLVQKLEGHAPWQQANTAIDRMVNQAVITEVPRYRSELSDQIRPRVAKLVELVSTMTTNTARGDDAVTNTEKRVYLEAEDLVNEIRERVLVLGLTLGFGTVAGHVAEDHHTWVAYMTNLGTDAEDFALSFQINGFNGRTVAQWHEFTKRVRELGHEVEFGTVDEIQERVTAWNGLNETRYWNGTHLLSKSDQPKAKPVPARKIQAAIQAQMFREMGN